MKMSVPNCARCGRHHEALEFLELSQPVTVDNPPETIATHWAFCPILSQPILLLVVPA